MKKSELKKDKSTSEKPKSLTAKAGILAIATASQQVIMLILAMILSRYLSVADYGSYQQLFMIYTILVTVVSLGLPASINYFIAKADSKEEEKAYVIQTYLMLLGMALIASVLFFFLSGLVSKGFHNPELNGLIKVYIWFFFFLTPIQFINQLLVVINKTKQLAIYRNVFAALRLVSVVIPVLLKADLKIIIISLVFFSFIQFVYTTLIIFKPYTNVKMCWSKLLLKTQTAYSVYIGLASILDIITKQLDQLMISFFFLSGMFAIYANGAKELPFIGLITGSVMAVLTPTFVRLYKEKKNTEILRIWHESARKIALILFPVTAFLILFAKECMIILFSSKYAESAIIFQIYLLTTPLRIVTYGAMLMAINKTKLIFRASIFALIIDTILNLLFIQWFGIIGPAISTVLVLYFLAGYHLRNIKNGLKIKYSEVMPWKKIFKLILLSVLPLIIILPIKMLAMPMLAKFIIAGIIYSIAFIMLILGLKEVTVKEIEGNIRKVLH